jgi:hypothetical protein
MLSWAKTGVDLSYEEYCKGRSINSDNSTSKTEYRQRIKTAKILNRMFSEKELGCLPTSSSGSDEFDKEIVELESEFEYKSCMISEIQSNIMISCCRNMDMIQAEENGMLKIFQ